MIRDDRNCVIVRETAQAKSLARAMRRPQPRCPERNLELRQQNSDDLVDGLRCCGLEYSERISIVDGFCGGDHAQGSWQLHGAGRSYGNCMASVRDGFICCGAALALGAHDQSAPASTPAVAIPSDEVGTWISQLGDDRFAIRETATEHLSHQGIEIQPRLLAALDDPDPEVRFRVRRILTMVIEGDFQRRLTAFAEDVNDTKHLSLPGWSRFRTAFASDSAGRKMFVEMQRAEPQLMQAFEAGPTAASQALESRLHEIQDAMQMRFRFGNNASVGMSSVMALLFVATDKQVTLNEEAAFQLCNFCVQPLTIQTNAGNGDSTVSRKIIGAWIARDASAQCVAAKLMARDAL